MYASHKRDNVAEAILSKTLKAFESTFLLSTMRSCREHSLMSAHAAYSVVTAPPVGASQVMKPSPPLALQAASEALVVHVRMDVRKPLVHERRCDSCEIPPLLGMR